MGICLCCSMCSPGSPLWVACMGSDEAVVRKVSYERSLVRPSLVGVLLPPVYWEALAAGAFCRRSC